MRRKHITVVITVVVAIALFWGAMALAGDPDNPPGPPETTSLYRLEDIYNRLATGAVGTKRRFTEPTSGPGVSSGHSLEEIMAVAPAVDEVNGASRGEVLAGKRVWGLISSQWGPITGTMPNKGAAVIMPTTTNQAIGAGYHDGSGYVAGDTDLLPGNIKSGVTLFGVIGNAVTASGNATDAQVLDGLTYSNANGASIGTMTNNGAGSTIVPTTTNQSVAAGYWSSANTVQGDSDLMAGNIRAGANIFGVGGDSYVVDTGSGDAVPSDILNGRVVWVDGSELTGSMADNGGVVITPTTITQTIAMGYHDGLGYVAGDEDLLSGNIKSGVDMFGVTGTLIGSSTYEAAVPKTGQTTCYNATTTISCGNAGFPGQDGDHQKGVAWPTPRFITGTTGVVTDTLSGLIWLKNANCAGIVVTWTRALTEVEELNTAGTMDSNNCGDTSKSGSHQTDWRLPNVWELRSLAHYGFYSPAVPNIAGTGQWAEGDPFTSLQSTNYWSSTTRANNTSYAWHVNMDHGFVGTNSKTIVYYVWPVRGGQ